MKKAIFFTFLIVINFACQEKKVKTGKITYEIEYPQFDKNERPLTYMMLPKKQTYRFNEKWIATKIKKATFDLDVMVTQKKDFLFSSFNFNEEEFLMLEGNQDVNTFTEILPKYDIELTDDEDTLLGLKIQKAVINHDGISTEAWFTDDLAIDNPNWFTPFNEIPGVLLKYVIKQFGVIMEFKAISLENIEEDYEFSYDVRGLQRSPAEFQENLEGIFKNLLND